nr:hypothetical protein GCM10020185_23970 [Pseudomonas brassicacearum subsp. brassicacearum]
MRHPKIHLDLCSEQEADDLLQGRSDLAFYFGQGSRPGTESLKLFGEELVPVCAPGSLPDQPFTDPTQLAELVLLQNASRPQAWHDWFDNQGYHTEHSYHGPRFETFYMCIRAAQVGCGVALLPRFLVEEELADGKLVIPWQHAMPSTNAYYLAYPEHSAEVPKVRLFLWSGCWSRSTPRIYRHNPTRTCGSKACPRRTRHSLPETESPVSRASLAPTAGRCDVSLNPLAKDNALCRKKDPVTKKTGNHHE